MKKHYVIGLPCAPSTMIGHKEIEATEFLYSYGGGMGGANGKMYVSSFHKEGVFFHLILIDGTRERLNENFVVKERKVKLVEVKTDVTAHSNYNKKNCSKAVETEYFLLSEKDTFSIDDRKYVARHIGPLNDIKLYKLSGVVTE